MTLFGDTFCISKIEGKKMIFFQYLVNQSILKQIQQNLNGAKKTHFFFFY